MSDVTMVADYACHTGEGPLWHASSGLLYWLDIPPGKVYRYDPATGEHALAVQRDEPVGALTIEADAALLLWQAEGRVFRWDGHNADAVLPGLSRHAGHRFNDAIADPEGRVFAGMMDGRRHSNDVLYRFDPGGAMTLIAEGVGRTNGLGFSPDLAWLYYADTHRGTIGRFCYDRLTGLVEDRRTLMTLDGPGRPDGLTVDAEGDLWIAMWGGGCVLRCTPQGRVVARIDVPTPNVSCVAFGGPDLDQLYITTAGGHEKEKLGREAGALFMTTPGVHGRAEFRSRLASFA